MGSMDFPNIQTERLADAIAHQLETLILEGVVQRGERLPSEREMARELKVSRQSLREALQKLESRGLVETRHGGGTYVKGVLTPILIDPLINLFQRHPETATDFVEFRYTLEGMAAYYAALRSTDEDRQLLAARFAAMVAAHTLEDPSEEAERDVDFHIAIAEASHNAVLLHVMRGLFALLRKGVFFNRTQLYVRPGARELLLKQHRAMYDAVMAGDPETARNAAHAHMAHVTHVLRDIMVDELRTTAARRRLSRYFIERRRPDVTSDHPEDKDGR